MKLITLLLGCALSFNLLASTPAANADVKALEAQIERLSNAMVTGDAAQLRALSSPDLSYGHSSGKVENQAQFIDQIASGRSDFVKINLHNQTINISGDTAIVRHELAADIADGGVPNSIRIGIMLVWKKEQQQWTLLARQAFKLPQ